MSGDLQTKTVPTRLRWQWLGLVAAATAFVVVGELFLSAEVGEAEARRWVVVAGGVLAFELWFLRRHLDQNRVDGEPTDDSERTDHSQPTDDRESTDDRRSTADGEPTRGGALTSDGDPGVGETIRGDGETNGGEPIADATVDTIVDTTADATDGGTDGRPVFPSLGPGNAVTLARGALYAVVAGFVVVRPTPAVVWIPALCYGGGAALDWVDGRIARWFDHVTVLGEKLDMAFDTLGFLVAPLVAVAWGRLPVWYLSLSAARYLFKAGRGFRRRRGRPVYDLPDSRVRRPLAGLQMAFLALALAPVVPATTLHVAAAVVLAPSLLVFVRDYLVVSGRLSHGDTV